VLTRKWTEGNRHSSKCIALRCLQPT